MLATCTLLGAARRNLTVLATQVAAALGPTAALRRGREQRGAAALTVGPRGSQKYKGGGGDKGGANGGGKDSK